MNNNLFSRRLLLVGKIFYRMKAKQNISAIARSGSPSQLKRWGLLLLALIAFGMNTLGATYYWRTAAGNGNWSSTTAWSTVSAAGGSAGTYPSSGDDVVISRNGSITVTLDGTYTCNSLLINYTGNTNGTIILSVPTTTSLTVTNGITYTNGGSGGENASIDVSGGTLSCASITMINTSGNNRDSYLLLSDANSIVNVSGSITMSGTNLRTYILFTAEGTLNVGGNMSGGGITSTAGGGNNPPTSGTVSYNGSGAQNVEAYTYYNLTISGGNTKTMLGSVNVDNTLNLNNGVLSLGSSSYDLSIADGGSITGSFDSNHMIRCDGTGNLYKSSTTLSGYVMVYPVGTGTYYSPFEITSLAATIGGGAYIRVRAVAGIAPSANPTDLNKHWIIVTNVLNSLSADASFTYVDPDEVSPGGDQSTYSINRYTGTAWVTPAGASPVGANPMTTTGTNTLAGTWTARETTRTLYSYQSGDWGTATTWTTDPSGTLSISPAVPGVGDRVVILNGRTITTAAARTVYSLQINEGGILDIAGTTGHDFGSVSGQGLLRLSTATFPGGTFSNFVLAGGGTVEYYNSVGFTFSQLDYNHLIINLNTSALIATLVGNMTINGNLTITTGRLQINDATTTSRTLTVSGNVYVSSTGFIQLGGGNVNHRFLIGGDFTNDGSVIFTERNASDYTGTFLPYARADVVFNNPSTDQDLLCNGTSNFYRIEIDKGIDQTYILNVDASSTANFNLWGRNDYLDSPPVPDAPDAPNPDALGLLAGTVRLGPNILLQSLSEGWRYYIDQDAQLWLDGASVTQSTVNSNLSFTVYGKLRVSNNATLNCSNIQQGIVLREQAVVSIESGTVTVPCVRTSSIAGIHRGEINISGGVLDVTGLTYALGDYASFTLPYATNVFRMSGGTINILAPSTAAGVGSNFSLLFSMDSQNAYVTGGTVNITVPTTRSAYINSNASLWDLNITSTSAANSAQIRAYTGGALPALAAQPLIVLHDFSIQGNAVFSTTNPAPDVDVTVGHDFTMSATSTYTPGTNTTTFNATGPQTFDASGTITGNLQNVTLANTSDLSLINKDITLNGNLIIGDGCTLRDNGRIISVLGNITNSGVHFKPVSGAGSIRLTGTAAQTISGDGTGTFNNLFLNKTGGSVTLTANMTITGELRLANTTARLNIGARNLLFGSEADVYDNLTGTGKTFSATRMIQTSGLASDGGVSKTVISTNAFIFPYGFYNAAITTYYYMPGSVQFSSTPTTYGTVTSTPVNMRHPLAQGANNALTCYWKTTSTGFTGIPAASVRHLYYYDPTPTNYFVPVPANEPLYVPGVYSNGTSWAFINDVNLVDQANNIVSYNVANAADGEFIAGEPSAFAAIPVRYSTGVNGDWDNTATWSSVGVGGAGGASVPTANTLVIIGDATHNHTVTINANGKTAGSLFVATGSTLDLRNYTGHNFASIPDKGVTGGGKLRIAANNYFPRGDFGEFIGENGGIVEYYTIAASVTIPTTSDVTALPLITYKNLILSNSGTYTVTLPNTNLTIFEDLIVTGAGTGLSRLNVTAARTVTVNRNFIVTSGTFEMQNVAAQSLIILGDLTISNIGVFQVMNNAGFTHNLEIWGNLTANGTFDLNRGTGYVKTTFKGTSNTSISGSAATIDFYNLFVDKGTNSTPVLTLTSTITTGVTNPFLTLLNGTFRVDNTTLTVTITNAATNFTIPSTACLSVNAGTVQVVWEANGGTNNRDLLLSGKLEVLGGSMVIGNTNNNTNNDIEYASTGFPEIVVSGGQLFVNGQIRRSITINSGSLVYRQSSGTTTINGRNLQSTRALFEITNSGSLFNTSGGAIVFVRAGGVTYGDAYIRPESASVTGGSIQFGDNSSPSLQDFTFSASVPLWDVTVGTSTVDQNVDLSVLPLTIKNLLEIDGNSVFRANGINLNFEGSITNNNGSAGAGINQGGFQAGSTTQIVTFNGTGTQAITGNGSNLTNFANMVIAATGTVTQATNSNIQINGDLTLTSGTLESAANSIYLKGDVDNSAIHSNNSGVSGGIVFSGTSKQYISGSGTGVFGNLIINNSSGVDMVDNSQIDGRLTLTNGKLYIDDYLLTFGTSASVAGTFSATRMILLNGTLSDRGVKKLFPTGASVLFRFPIGVAGKYTPATYTITANSAPGSITVTPVNGKHPATTDALTNELAYYWYVRSTGFSSPTLTHTYTYLQADVSGTESSYVGGQYDFNLYTWTDLGNVVDETTPTTGGTITLTDVNYIKGEYTAGIASNFGTVNTLYSRDAKLNNNWNDPNNWSIISHAGASCGCIPNGNPVIIKAGHTIELNVNSAVAYSVEVNGTLDASTTVYHSLGHVFGTGKIDVTSTAGGIFVFPGGEFDTFFDTPGTTLEFKGTTNATLPLKPGNVYKPYQNVIFSGTGIKYMSAENMKILGNMIIRSGTVLSDALYNKNLFVLGNWTDENTTADGFVPGTGTVSFEGTSNQQINVGRTEKFYNFKINNTNGVDLLTSAASTGIQISKYLYLTVGNIKSYSDKLVKVSNTSISAVVGGGATSFVDGYLSKNIINGQSFNFPIGNGTRYGKLYIWGTTGGTGYWVGSYVYSDPSPTYPTAAINLNSPITAVSNNEYWVIARPIAGATANVRLRWDATSYPSYTGNALLRPRLRVVEYEGAAIQKWSERGSIVSGDASAGTISTSIPVTQNDYVFSIGVIGVSATFNSLAPLSICDNGENASVAVNLTGTSPWTLSYRTVGGTTTNFTQTGITSSPYTIQLTGSDIGGSAGSPYTLSLVSVSDASSAGICSANTVTITVNVTYTPDITGTFTVGTSETRAYSTAVNAGSTYAWSWVGASGGSFNTATSNPTNITFTATPGTYQLQLVETSSSLCTSTDVQAIEVSVVPAPDITPKTANICIGSTVVYSTAYVANHEYYWTVTNGTCTGCGAWSVSSPQSVSVTWNSTGDASLTVREHIIGSGSPGIYTDATQNFYISPMPNDRTVTAALSSICDGSSTNLVVGSSESGISYQLRNDAGDVNIGTAVAGNGSDINLPTGSLTPAAVYTFNVLAYNSGCQLEIPIPPLPTVTVNPLPTATVSGLVTGSPACEGEQVQVNLVFTGTPPFAFTMQDGQGNSWSESGINVLSGATYTYDIPLAYSVWISPTLPTNYVYSLVSASDATTCSAASPSGSATVDIYKVLETGPEYHIPNDFGF